MSRCTLFLYDLFCVLLSLLIMLGVAAEVLCGGEPAEATVLLDFYADWCQPCQAMRVTVESLERDGFSIERINIDKSPDRARQYGVNAIPCFVVLYKGREIDRISGVVTAERLKVRMRKPAEKIDKQNQPAWRYERPVGYRAAVVRVFCQDDVRTRSIGSGTLVKWGGKLFVLTARHVVQDAKQIVVEFFYGKKSKAHVLKVDATWDCAALQLDAIPDDVEPAEIELGQDAIQREGDRLESCGYGPDGRLACNTGLFIGYRRSTAATGGPDDWMVISGHARGGDSGGGVFHRRGRLVGVLWGTDGCEVVCVQAGRIHVVLNDSLRYFRQQAAGQPLAPLVPVSLSPSDRRPTPPMNSAGCCPVRSADCQPGPVPYEPSRNIDRTPALPWRADSQQRDQTLERQINGLIELERLRIAREAQRPAESIEAVKPRPVAKPNAEQASPIVAGICILGAIALGFVLFFAAPKK